jgi:hypothetical protein
MWRLKCEVCGAQDGSVEWTIDPYMDEIHDEQIEVCMCADCLHDRAMDI